MKKADTVVIKSTNGKEAFVVSLCGIPEPEECFASFCMEKGIRERWWLIEEGDVVVDVGAGWGSYTLPALAQGGMVVAYEPCKEEFFALCASIAVNGWSSRCVPLAAVAGEKGGVCRTFDPSSHSVNKDAGKAERRMSIPVDAMAEGFLRMDWLKVDVEGMEEEVLKGSMKSVEKFRPTIIVENHLGFVPDVQKRIAKLLKPLGYKEENLVGDGGLNANWSRWTFTKRKDKK